jgi:AraC-like DNA-binding protein
MATGQQLRYDGADITYSWGQPTHEKYTLHKQRLDYPLHALLPTASTLTWHSTPLDEGPDWRDMAISGMVWWLWRPLNLNEIRLTKAQQFWPLTDYLSSYGIPMGRYIERFRISKKMLDAPDIFIDEARFWRLSNELAAREGFLDWGFRAGQHLDFSMLGEFGDVLLRQPTLKAALEAFVRTISAETQSTFSLMQQGEHTWLMMSGCRNAPEGRDIVELYDLQFFCKLVQQAAGSQWRPPFVHLQADSLPAGLGAAEITAGSIRFSSTMMAIAIPVALMAAPMRNYAPFRTEATAGQHDKLAGANFSTSLRLLLVGYLDESLTIRDCADLVGMSNRTLQRRLAAHGVSFNELLDQIRFDTAKQLLENNAISVTDISGELGYTDPASFTRAFRRWAGVSPRQHRQLHRQPH